MFGDRWVAAALAAAVEGGLVSPALAEPEERVC
jgi:hypothetical protein